MILDYEAAAALPAFKGVPRDRLENALVAANDWVQSRVRPRPADEEKAPGGLRRAVELMTNRYLARESSPDGFVGMQETGSPAYIGRVERDAEALIAPYRPVVFA